MLSDGAIEHVSDTAIWVAYYRAIEAEQKSPLFSDPLAKVLVGERGKKISDHMGSASRFTRWSIVIRTHIIDSYIQNLVSDGVDTVINLGAGLDTRPYRLDLPNSLRWIEVDYPHMIEHKEKLLAAEKPQVKLERISLDLADQKLRQELFNRLGSESRKALVITEGVVPYLSEEQVASLAEDLYAQKNFSFWIAEYFSPNVYRYFKSKKRVQQLRNAPFKFFPADWFGFFKLHGWKPEVIRYLTEESIQMKRKIPMPWWAYLFIPFMSKEKGEKYKRQSAYVVYTKT